MSLLLVVERSDIREPQLNEALSMNLFEDAKVKGLEVESAK